MTGSVVLIGVDYFPFRHINEKNYWHTLLPMLSTRVGMPLHVLSVNQRPEPLERQESDGGMVLVHNVRPARLLGDLPAGTFEASPYLHRFPVGPLRRSLTLARSSRLLDELVGAQETRAVHFMDNFGEAMNATKRRYPRLAVTASLPTWMDRLGRLKRVYHWVRRRSFAGLDAVVTPAAATARRMQAAGFPAGQVQRIPWGVLPLAERDPAARARGRAILDVPAEAPLLVWSGFTQRSTEEDLLFAVSLARAVRTRSPDTYAVFAFKPADLDPRYETFRDGHTRVLRTDPRTFPDVLAAGDLFVSPVTEPGRTVTPPLTWLEAMDVGLPVVTTPAEGATDVVAHGVNGVIVDSPEAGAAPVAALLSDPAGLARASGAARQLVARTYDLRSIVEQYVQLWHLD